MIPLNADLRVVPTFDIAGVTKAQNVYHLRHMSSEEQTDVDVIDACTNWVIALMDNMVAELSDQLTLEKVEVYIWELTEWNPVGVGTTAWAGESTSPRMPAGMSVMMRAYKPRSGYADRKFLPGLTEASAFGDELSGAIVTTAALAAADWITSYSDPNGVDLLGVYWNRVQHVAVVYVSSSVATQMGYQRRRKPGVGLT